MERLSAPERTREELRALMNGELGTAAGRSDLVRLALRLIVEEALEGEVSDVLGRERYERGEGEKRRRARWTIRLRRFATCPSRLSLACERRFRVGRRNSSVWRSSSRGEVGDG